MKKQTIRTIQGLVEHKLINKTQRPLLEEVAEQFSVSITPQLFEQMDVQNPRDPIARQFVPSAQELFVSQSELADPIGDDAHKAVKGIVHRYPDRCLFTPVHVCPVYCRFCFRREKVGEASETLTPHEIDAAIDYIASQENIWEVILTGGDPLILKPVLLGRLLQRLADIPHVEVIRIHTRVPVVDSLRITPDMLQALRLSKPVYIVLHANHPAEFSQAAKDACTALVDAGLPMLSQTVLLNDLNDNIEVLSELMRCFIRLRIKPYYLHHADLAKGTGHFRTSIAKGQELMRQLRGRFSGLCQPTYVLDIPNGYGKVPIGPNYIARQETGDYLVEDYQGAVHSYKSVEQG